MHIRVFKIALFTTLASAFLVILGVGFCLYRSLIKPMYTEGVPIVVEVKRHSSAQALLEDLKNRHLIKSIRLPLEYIQFRKLSNRFKAGFYQIMPNESICAFLNKVVAGKVLVSSFRIADGVTLQQINEQLKQIQFLHYRPDDLQSISSIYSSVEGLLFPDTYRYNAGSDALDVLKKAHIALLSVLEEAWRNRSPNLPYKTSYEMLIAASILEKEAALPEERAIISGIIINRLHKHMRLQMDPTVIYALGSAYQGRLRRTDLQIDSPFNTYRYFGLPPTPIAMASKNAILAAAHPVQSSYYYFVSKGDGTHYFSKDYKEQRKAVRRYLS